MKTPASLQTILDTASLSGRHVTGLRGDFRSRMAAFRRNRAASEQTALEGDFTLVLAAWGLRLLVFLAPALACFATAAWSHSPLAFLSLACIAPPCLLGIITTLWRISILRHRRFTPLCRWLLWFRKRP